MGRKRIKKTRRKAGFNAAGRDAKATKQSGISDCNSKHISKLVQELHDNGFRLKNTTAVEQRRTLLLVLQYLGARGLNTFEGTALGLLRMATRVFELRQDWNIDDIRRPTIGPDGYLHMRVARYHFKGPKNVCPQLELPLGDV